MSEKLLYLTVSTIVLNYTRRSCTRRRKKNNKDSTYRTSLDHAFLNVLNLGHDLHLNTRYDLVYRTSL